MPERIPVYFQESHKEDVKLKSEADVKLSKLDLGELARWVNSYNAQFNWGSILGRNIVRGIHEAEAEAKRATLEESESEEQQQRISLEEITQRTREMLQQSGLSLESVHGVGTIFSSETPESVRSSELRINLSDGKRFLKYLENLNGRKLTESQKNGLETVVSTLTTQLKGEYELDNPEDTRLLELFGVASKLIVEYERLEQEGAGGMAQAVATLKRLVEFSKKGYLREHLLAEKAGLLEEIGGENFGPSKWHTDSSWETYKKYWEGALETVKILKKNPKASELLSQVQRNLEGSIRYAKNDIRTKLAEGNREYFAWWNNEAFKFLDDIRKAIG